MIFKNEMDIFHTYYKFVIDLIEPFFVDKLNIKN